MTIRYPIHRLALAFEALARPDGGQRPELFVEDEIHFSAAGYKLRAQLVRPYLEVFKDSNKPAIR